VSVATQLWLVPTPPQSTVSVDVPAAQVPVQPVRLTVPSVIAAPVNDPSMPGIAVPLSALPLEANVIVHALCVTHCAAVALTSPQPWPLIEIE
jgi:hypothetical protein